MFGCWTISNNVTYAWSNTHVICNQRIKMQAKISSFYSQQKMEIKDAMQTNVLPALTVSDDFMKPKSFKISTVPDVRARILEAVSRYALEDFSVSICNLLNSGCLK